MANLGENIMEQKMKRKGQERLGIYVSEQIHKDLMIIAHKRNITLTRLVNRILLRYIIKDFK